MSLRGRATLQREKRMREVGKMGRNLWKDEPGLRRIMRRMTEKD